MPSGFRSVGVPFISGVALLLPAWSLAAIVRDWVHGGSGAWPHFLLLAAAVVWVRAWPWPAAGPGRRSGLAGLAVGIVVVSLAVTPVVLAVLVVLAGATAANRPAAVRELPPAAADEGRRVRRLFRLATSGSVAGEIRVHGLGPHLMDEHGKASRTVITARAALARRLLFGEIRRGLIMAAAVLAMVLAAVAMPSDGSALLAVAWATAAVAGQAFR